MVDSRCEWLFLYSRDSGEHTTTNKVRYHSYRIVGGILQCQRGDESDSIVRENQDIKKLQHGMEF